MAGKRIAILGDAGFARELFFLIQRIRDREESVEVHAFVVREAKEGSSLFGVPIVGEDRIPEFGNTWFVTGMGNPVIKRQVVDGVRRRLPEARFATLIHPDVEAATGEAFGSQALMVGEGTVVTAGNILTVNIVLGAHVHVNLDCTVGHDTFIEDYATLSPGVHVSGNVRICKGAFLGTGASVIEGKRIGEGAIVGAGACVVTDIPDYTLAVGVPAKAVKELPRD